MRSAVMTQFVHFAKADNPVAKMVSKSIEAGFVVSSTLAKVLAENKYQVKERSGKRGVWVEIYATSTATLTSRLLGSSTEPLMVAQAYSSDKADALLQAVAAWLRETVTLDGGGHG